MKPLSIGNVVSAGLKIYRGHFKDYYYIAFIAALWSLIPIYGWAKSMTNISFISRLAFGEVTSQSETIEVARKHTYPKSCRFLGAGIAVGLRFIGYFYLLWAMPVGILSAIVNVIGTSLSIRFEDTEVLIYSLQVNILLVSLSLLFVLVWLISRYLIVDVLISIEDDHDASSAIKRTLNLSKRNIHHIYVIVMVTVLISIPLWSVAIILQFIPSYLGTFGILAPLITIASLVLGLATNALIVPFWQSIKAVIYYNLLVNREGYGLELDA